jgi:hypothetical protein
MTNWPRLHLLSVFALNALHQAFPIPIAWHKIAIGFSITFFLPSVLYTFQRDKA